VAKTMRRSPRVFFVAAIVTMAPRSITVHQPADPLRYLLAGRRAPNFGFGNHEQFVYDSKYLRDHCRRWSSGTRELKSWEADGCSRYFLGRMIFFVSGGSCLTKFTTPTTSICDALLSEIVVTRIRASFF